MEKTIGQVLDQTIERWGDCLAPVSRHQSKRYSWRQLRELADCVTRGSGPNPCLLCTAFYDRIGGWQLMYQLLLSGRLPDTCPKLISWDFPSLFQQCSVAIASSIGEGGL